VTISYSILPNITATMLPVGNNSVFKLGNCRESSPKKQVKH